MITWSDLGSSVWLTAFLIIVSFFVFLFVFIMTRLGLECIPGRDRMKNAVLAGLAAGMPLGFTGIVCGFLTGSSKTPAVSALVPAALTLIGLMIVYLLGRGLLRAVVTGLAVFVFAINLVMGAFLGTNSRIRYEEYLESVEFQKSKAVQELAIRLFRTGLGLPPEPSKPVQQPVEK